MESKNASNHPIKKSNVSQFHIIIIMKKEIKLLGMTACLVLLLFSCKPETFTKEFPVNDKVIEFEVAAAERGEAARTEEILYEGDLTVNVASIVEQSGFSFDHIKSFIIEQGSVELVAPEGFDMNHFIGMKLYFENQNQLVARADVLDTNGTIKLSIVNGNLLDKLKENKLHLIVTGVRPNVMVKLKLRTNYLVGVSLFK